MIPALCDRCHSFRTTLRILFVVKKQPILPNGGYTERQDPGRDEKPALGRSMLNKEADDCQMTFTIVDISSAVE